MGGESVEPGAVFVDRFDALIGQLFRESKLVDFAQKVVLVLLFAEVEAEIVRVLLQPQFLERKMFIFGTLDGTKLDVKAL